MTHIGFLTYNRLLALGVAPGTGGWVGARLVFGDDELVSTSPRFWEWHGSVMPVYCIDPALSDFPNGYPYPVSDIDASGTKLAKVMAVLYFGYGGPGFDARMWPSRPSYMSPAINEAYWFFITHLMLTEVMAGNADYAFGTRDGVKPTSWPPRAWYHANIDNSGGLMDSIFARANEVPDWFKGIELNLNWPVVDDNGVRCQQFLTWYKATGTVTLEKGVAS